MLRFAVYDAQDRPARAFALRHAHAFGPDDLPVAATITAEDGIVTVDRAGTDSTGLCVQMEVPGPDAGLLKGVGVDLGGLPPVFRKPGVEGVGTLGLLTLQTSLLPRRDEPYILTLELARRQIMLFLNKLEEWGLFDYPPAEGVLRSFDASRRAFTGALVASRKGHPGADHPDPKAWASHLAMQALALIVDAGERLSIVAAERDLPERLAGTHYEAAVKTYTKMTGDAPAAGAAIAIAGWNGVSLPGVPSVGVTVEAGAFSDGLCKAASAAGDFITIPMRWNEMEPSEGKYSYTATDRWIEWAVRTAKMPVVGGPLLDFRARCIPEWLYIWENDYETLRDLVIEHIQAVVTRYRRTVGRWTVASGLHVNGDLKLSVDQIIDLTRVGVAVVRKLQPTARVQIGIDEPWGEYHAARKRSLPPLLYADALMQVGLNVDTIGVRVAMGQGGSGGGGGASGRSTRDLMSLSALLDRYAAFNRPIAVTAVGVPALAVTRAESAPMMEEGTEEAVNFEGGTWRSGVWTGDLQADWATQALAIMVSKPFVQSVCWQQLADGTASGGVGDEMPGGGMIGAGGAVRPVLSRVAQIRQALREGKGTAGFVNLGVF
jgi:hypothetical protein